MARVLNVIRRLSLGVLVLACLGWSGSSILLWTAEADLPDGPSLTSYPLLNTHNPPAAGWEEAVERVGAYRSAQVICSAVGVIALAVHLVVLNLQVERMGRKLT